MRWQIGAARYPILAVKISVFRSPSKATSVPTSNG